MKKFKVGDYIKLKSSQRPTNWEKDEINDLLWYHENIMKIIEIHNMNPYHILYNTDYIKWRENGYGTSVEINSVYQDKECISKLREEKLKKILDEI